MKIDARGDMSASPAKRAAEDVCPGVRTPTDASPETSAATPEDGDRLGRRKRGRSNDFGAGTRDDGGETTRDGERDLISGSGARREAIREARVRAIGIELREIAGGVVDAVRGTRRGGYARRRRVRLKSERERRDAGRGVRGVKTDDGTCARVVCRCFDGDARTSALMKELTRVERYV